MAVQFLPTVHKGNTFAREFHSAADKNLLSHDITMSYKNAHFVGGKSHSSHFGGLGLNVGYYKSLEPGRAGQGGRRRPLPPPDNNYQ
jgi:hypothetical protein